MVKQISQGQVKEIFYKIQERYTLVNLGTHYIITKNETNETTSYTYDSNFVFLDFCKEIRHNYLLIIFESMNYFNTRRCGYDVAGEREKYLNKIIYKIIEWSCGFKVKQ